MLQPDFYTIDRFVNCFAGFKTSTVYTKSKKWVNKLVCAPCAHGQQSFLCVNDMQWGEYIHVIRKRESSGGGEKGVGER